MFWWRVRKAGLTGLDIGASSVKTVELMFKGIAKISSGGGIKTGQTVVSVGGYDFNCQADQTAFSCLRKNWMKALTGTQKNTFRLTLM